MDNYSLRNCLKLINENNEEIRRNALNVLWELCENIIKHPHESKYRKIRIANPVIAEKLFPASGGVECLFEIGFQEDGEFFTLPAANFSLPRIREIQKHLNDIRQTMTMELPLSTEVPMIKSTGAATAGAKPKDSRKPNFLQRIEEMFEDVMKYENTELQEITRRIVPIVDLKLRAIKRMRVLQKELKGKNDDTNKLAIENDVSIEDLLLCELLAWFKNEFFTWVNTLTCSFCSATCKYNRNEYTRDLKISRIEIHKCELCNTEEEFPRYTDPRILLTTRRGRCGEWANTFTLICRALSYDARLVHDETDHVWTEVWSIAGNRWIHADPCENSMDCPLLYEKGWKKKLTYVIAYSRDEIQDVTWRYTRDQAAVMKRRNLCTEEDLVALVWRLNEQRQNSPGYSSNSRSSSSNSNARKRFVIKRRLMELAEFLKIPGLKNDDDDNNEYGGRISGDTAWRIARGELTEKNVSHVWKIPKNIRSFHLRFFLVKDYYEARDDEGRLLKKIKGWREGVESCNGIIRNVENDWKMVYLSRSLGNLTGNISWAFEICDSDNNDNDDIRIEVNSLEVSPITATFHGASIKWKIQGITRDDNPLINLEIDNCEKFSTNELKNVKKIIITAELSSGIGDNGDVSWQYAQLFRHKLNAVDDCSMSISLKLL